jgi:hypothetical protein
MYQDFANLDALAALSERILHGLATAYQDQISRE